MSARPLRFLLAGPLPPPIGGASVSFASLAEALDRRSDVRVTIVDTVGVRGKGLGAAAPLARLVGALRAGLRDADVMVLHVATSALHSMGPLSVMLARGSGVRLVIRKFAGTSPGAFGPARAALSKWALTRADLYLAQTRRLVDEAHADGIERVVWFPNSRSMPELPEDHDGSRVCGRFVFLGHVRRGKGVQEIIDAAERFDEGVSVDIYGPLDFGIDSSAFEGLWRVRYRGILEPHEVQRKLADYDALLLPTRFSSEGYPGAILEAYAAGIPVVATPLGAIPEIVDETTGLMVEPGSADALYDAMRALNEDPELCRRLRAGVRARRGEFSSELWHDRFVGICRGIVWPSAESVK